MFKRKSLVARLMALGIAITSLFATPISAMAVTDNPTKGEEPLSETISIESEHEISPLWLAYGPINQYPSEGGTWTYGFWDAKVRSYYTVNRSHGSTVILNGNVSRSVDTAAGRKSIAEKWAVQYPTHDDRYYYRVN